MTDEERDAGIAQSAPDVPQVPRSRLVAVGCFTAFLGCVSGGMVGVLVAKFVAFLTRAETCPGIPTCDWYLYWAGGALVGALTLPALAVRALRRPHDAGA